MTNQNHTSFPTSIIQYRGFYTGPGEWGGDTCLFPTHDEALAAAQRHCHRTGDKAWVNAEFVGPAETVLVAVEPIRYIERRPFEIKTLAAGKSIDAGTLMERDPHVTPWSIAGWLLDGKIKIGE